MLPVRSWYAPAGSEVDLMALKDDTKQTSAKTTDDAVQSQDTPEVANVSGAESQLSSLKIFRASQQEEILAIRDIALEFHAESRYAHLPFSEKKFVRAFSKAISHPHNTLALYVSYNGDTVGVLNAGVGDYYLGEGGRMVTVYVMYVSAKIRGTFLGGKVGLRLIRMVSDWAQAQGAEELHIHATSGIDPERTDKLLKRVGFKVYGGNYVVRVG